MAGGINEDGVALGRRRFSLDADSLLRERDSSSNDSTRNSITLCSFIILSRYNSFEASYEIHGSLTVKG